MHLGEGDTGSSLDWQKIIQNATQAAAQIYTARYQAKAAQAQAQRAPSFPMTLPTDGYIPGFDPYQMNPNYSPVYQPVRRQDNTMVYVAVGGAIILGLLLITSRR